MRRAYDALGLPVPPTTQPGLLPNQAVQRGVRMPGPGMQTQPGAMANVRLPLRDASSVFFFQNIINIHKMAKHKN